MAIAKKLAPGSWVHFTAIGGTGMGALAALLKDSGHRVTGSDGPLYPPMSTFLMEEKKIPIRDLYHSENLKGETWGFPDACPALVVVGNAISRGHVEAAAVETLVSEGKTRRLSFAEGLAEFAIDDNRSFVIVGTHGKTTTTSLMTWCFEELGREPGFFIGGIPKNFGRGCRMSHSTRGVFVSEGDEYDTAYWDKESKFLHYRPSWVLCTSIELDHVDIFKNVEAVEQAFVKLAHKIREGLVLIDDQSAPSAKSLQPMLEAAKLRGSKVLRYGWQENSDYRLLSCEAVPLPMDASVVGSKLKVRGPGEHVFEFHSPMIGAHNALNVVGILAVLLESGELGDGARMEALLAGFAGIKRRQEEVFKDPSFIVIDDFAHHPTAIKETLLGLKARYRGSKMAAFFEPRSATSGRNALKKEFEEAFFEADAIFITPPTKTNIPENEKLDVEAMAAAIRKKDPGKHVFINADVDVLTSAYMEWQRRTPATRHVAAVMTNGPFGGLHKKLEEAYLAKKKIRGQAAVEYILIAAMIVGVVVGVLYPILDSKMTGYQNELQASTTKVARQESLGIPLAWFQAGVTGADVDSKLAAASGSFAAEGGPEINNVPDDPNAGLNKDVDKKNRGDEDPNSLKAKPGADENGNDDNRSRGSGGRGGGGGGGRASKGPSAGDDGGDADGKGGSGSSEFDDKRSASTADSGVAGGLSGRGGNPEAKTDEELAAEEENPEDVNSKRARAALGQKPEDEAGGCGNMNMYTLLKIAIAIAVFLLGAAVIVTTKGQKGSK